MLPLLILSAVLVATCTASHGGYYANRAGEAHVNYVNGLRQAYVNHAAEAAGAGTGTAEQNGVPGTHVGNDHLAHGHGFYGHGYGHGYGHAYGYGIYPDQYNANRQKYVNAQAVAVGAGVGTYKEDGVPGTYLDKNHPTGFFHHAHNAYGHH